ncbi:hypothetical protein YC2023_025866 [Brassica napus]
MNRAYIVLGLPSGEEALKLSEKEGQYILRGFKDEKGRKLFDELLRIQREKQEKKSQEERERSGFAPTRAARGYDEVERIARKLKEEVDRIRAMYAKKRGGFETPESGGVDGKKKEDRSGAGAFVQLDKERALKVSLVKVIQWGG